MSHVSIASNAMTVDDIHLATGVHDARTKLNLRGAGVKIAVIDSGIYYLHPALGGCFGSGCKVAFGYDFVGDSYTYDGSQVPVPDADPLDNCSSKSHGTHVAGIIAANASNLSSGTFATPFPFTGVAPEATIGAYRVFGCSGSTGDDIITAAIYRAAADGADIINLSLGGGPRDGESIDTLAASAVSAAGHIVVASAGNDGEAGLFAVGVPAVGAEVLAVASFDNAVSFSLSMTVDSVSYPYNIGSSNGSFNSQETLNIVVNDVNAIVNNVMTDGCSCTFCCNFATFNGFATLGYRLWIHYAL